MEHTRRALGLGPKYELEGFASEAERIDSYFAEITSLLKQRAEGRMDHAEERFTELRRELLATAFLTHATREFLNRHRSLQQFWDRSASKVRSYKERREMVDAAFDSSRARLEQDGTSLVELDEDVLHALDMSEASRIWDKATKRLTDHNDSDGALTLTRTLLETVCKKILDAFGDSYSSGDAIQSLCKKALSHVIPPGISGREHFQHFTRSMLNMVEHIALYRAEASDAHGGAAEKAVKAHQAAYAVNLAGSTALFLIECYRTTPE